jgi:phosphoribosyl-dephospho-CoA transferase
MASLELAQLSRHGWVWLKAGVTWRRLGDAPHRRLEAWFDSGLPAVVARCQGDEPPDHLRLGVALPPAEGKQRLNIAVSAASVARWRPPLSLREVMGCSPADWSYALKLLLTLAEEIGLEPRVYGSFAWHALTGEKYITAESDLDLIWRLQTSAELASLLAALPRWENSTGRCADGEVLLPSGAGVCWRELAGVTSRVLVKSHSTAELRPRAEILSEYVQRRPA